MSNNKTWWISRSDTNNKQPGWQLKSSSSYKITNSFLHSTICSYCE